jgi:hypothetical protein
MRPSSPHTPHARPAITHAHTPARSPPPSSLQELLIPLSEDVVPNAGTYYMRSLSGAEQGDDTDDLDYD